MSRCWLEISRSRIRANIDLIRSRIPDEAGIIAVVKADAYGLGIGNILPILLEYGIHHFAVATLEEAIELRSRSVEDPILVLGGCLEGEELDFQKYDLTASVFSAESVPKQGIRVELEVDTGMTRLGIPWNRVAGFVKDHELRLEGVYSQFASADADPGFSRLQLKRFEEATADLSCPRHMCSTPALAFPEAYLDRARIGLALYGIGSPSMQGELQPAMTWKTRILAVNEVPAGRVVGYGGTFSTQHGSRIAVLPVGYADGFSRALSNCGRVLVGDWLAPVVGRVSMDFTTVDVTEFPAQVGDLVTLMDADSASPIGPHEVARLHDTIAYEVLTSIGSRVRRVVVD